MIYAHVARETISSLNSAVGFTAATSTVVAPKAAGALVMTDIIVSGEKINAGIITVQFTDDTNDVVITINHVNDGPVNMATSLQGLCLGWKDAKIQFITSTSNQDATVTVWYYFVSGVRVKSFDDWNADRG